MSEQNKFVGDTTLVHYDTNIKNWFQEKIDSVPMMDIAYDEDNRILEFTEGSESDSSGGNTEAKIETYTLTFPECHITEKLHYTDENLNYVSHQRMTNEALILKVPKNTIIHADSKVFDGTVYLFTKSDATVLDGGHTIVIRNNIEFGYADNAPR